MTNNYYQKQWKMKRSEKIHYDHVIYKKVLNFLHTQAGLRSFLIYWPRENEPETIALIDQLLQEKKRVSLMAWKNAKIFQPVEIKRIDFPSEYHYSCRAPIYEQDKVVPLEELDCLIVPVVLYDGYANYSPTHSIGIFDRYIDDHRLYKIGLGYDFCCYKDLILNPRALDTVITNKE